MKGLMIILGLIFVFFLGGDSSSPQQSTYSFFVAGHTYGAPGVNNAGLHPPFKAQFEYLKRDSTMKFGVLTGDIVNPMPTRQDWDEVDADINKLGLPVHFAVGNHDMENRAVYEERYGKTYYAFKYENDLFIILDPNLDAWNISGEQYHFLDTVLSNNQAEVNTIFVFFHQLLWRDDQHYSEIVPNSMSGKAPKVNFWTEIEPLFHRQKNQVVMFSGDIGAGAWSTNFMFDEYDNITFLAGGMGSGVDDNFFVIHVDENKEVSYDVIFLNKNAPSGL